MLKILISIENWKSYKKRILKYRTILKIRNEEYNYSSKKKFKNNLFFKNLRFSIK